MLSKILGYDPLVDKVIDAPVGWLHWKHRELFHFDGQAEMIGMALDGPRGALGGAFHRGFDVLASSDKQFKLMLELMARTAKPTPSGDLILVKEKLDRLVYVPATS